MYTCVLAEIGVRFPFTEFKRVVLRQLNCAPTQIHPNSWGFIQVLMEYLGEEPSLELLFHLFQSKGVDRGVWVNFSSHQVRSLFSLFKASYKDFKSFYIKCLDIDELCERDAGLSDFLFETVKSGKILTTSKLLKWEKDRDVVVKYTDTKVEQGSEVNKPSGRRPISVKRMRSEEASGKKVIDLTEDRCYGKDISLEEVANFTKSQQAKGCMVLMVPRI
ncbi:hypothetical protein PIB30_049004 [Stylosanthes scabra]|uniref:Transposase (putative) gypsy type domain-containing protein n=1 Tax=Stylosanthes scabra TaxID=79078 RepID=A0ABU6ZG37_9FABA|nr:hypothetical protein [Stylosanthes scabra]